MRSPVHALLWERWRQTRWGVFLACGLLLACAAPCMVLNDVDEGLKLGSVFLFCALIGLMQMTRFEVNRMEGGFPSHLFRLPMRTGAITLVHAGYGAVVLGAFALLALILASLAGGVRDFGHAVLIFTSAELAYAFFLLMARCKSPFHPLVLALAVPILPLLCATMLAFMKGIDIRYPPLLTAAAVALSGACAAGVAWAARKERVGDLKIAAKWIDDLYDWGVAPKTAFASPGQAHVWYELRRTGRLFPGMVVAFAFCLTAFGGVARYFGVLFDNPDGFPDLPTLSLAVIHAMWFAVPTSGICAGLAALAVRHQDRVAGSMTLVDVRPMDGPAMAAYRMQASARSIAMGALALVFVAAILAVWAWAEGKSGDWLLLTPESARHLPPLVLVGWGLAACAGMFAFVWTLYWLGGLLLFGYFAFGILVLLGGLGLLVLGTGPGRGVELLVACAVSAAICLVAVVGAWWYALTHGLVRRRAFGLAVCSLPIVAALHAAFFAWAGGIVTMLPPSEELVASLAAIMTILFYLPFAALPICHSRQHRHLLKRWWRGR
ncbi:MAG: hypothetical protein GY851_27465 [bacterium]|nr:hypothetical protein [bacterium]